MHNPLIASLLMLHLKLSWLSVELVAGKVCASRVRDTQPRHCHQCHVTNSKGRRQKLLLHKSSVDFLSFCSRSRLLFIAFLQEKRRIFDEIKEKTSSSVLSLRCTKTFPPGCKWIARLQCRCCSILLILRWTPCNFFCRSASCPSISCIDSA